VDGARYTNRGIARSKKKAGESAWLPRSNSNSPRLIGAQEDRMPKRATVPLGGTFDPILNHPTDREKGRGPKVCPMRRRGIGWWPGHFEH